MRTSNSASEPRGEPRPPSDILAAIAAAMAEPAPPPPTTRQTRAGEVEALGLGGAGEPHSVKHVAMQRAVRPAQDRVAGAGYLDRDADLVEEAGRRHLVRHRHQRAADVAQAEQWPQKTGVVLRLD